MALLAACSTNWNFENTGLANERFDGNTIEYLASNPYDWDSVRLVIERAGWTTNFSQEKFTFFGPTNHSIRRWMKANAIETIATIPVETCRELINAHVLDGELLRDDIPAGELVNAEWRGGESYTFRSGRSIAIYRVTGSYMNVAKAGAAEIYLRRGGSVTGVASSNIRTANGVVHSLEYAHIFGTL
jgi:uncharacterized surface protein with fasciclin (FAS1) repeats